VPSIGEIECAVDGATGPIARSDDEAMRDIAEEERQSERAGPAVNPPGWWRLRRDLGVARRQRCPASPPPRSL